MGDPGDQENRPRQVLRVRVDLTRESDRSLKAWATVDVMRKARLELPEDWPDLPSDLPEEMVIELDQGDLGINLEILVGLALDNALKAAFEELFGVDLEMGTLPPDPGTVPAAGEFPLETPVREETEGGTGPAVEEVVMSAEELELVEVDLPPEEAGEEPFEDKEEEGE
ncbi:MAG: hypothetical protein AB1896_12460 [Thermodesulfobacteriota bacterium]